MDHVKLVSRILKFATSGIEPDSIINKALEFLGRELNADRAYIFEETVPGFYDNTYEWCREGVTPQIDNLKNVPYIGVCDHWFHEFDKSSNIIIPDLEEYRHVAPGMYEVLKPQDIHSLLAGPLELDGRYIGFFGVDNPPVEDLQDISTIVTLLEYSMSLMIRYRDSMDLLTQMSLKDRLTGVMNRHALEYDIEKLRQQSAPLGLMMGDINGLKAMNDTHGHVEGDRLIRNTAEALVEAFSTDRVYRMGGDEFVALSVGQSEEAFAQRVETARAGFLARGAHVAVGAIYRPALNESLDDLVKAADVLMYEEKAAFYRTHDRRRRRD